MNERPWEFEIGEQVALRGVGPGGAPAVVGEITHRFHTIGTDEHRYKVLDQDGTEHTFSPAELRRARCYGLADVSYAGSIFPYDLDTCKQTGRNKTTKLTGVPGWEAEVFTVMRDTREDDPFADVQLRFTPRDPAARTISIDMGVEAAGFEHVAADHIGRLYLDTLRFFGVIG